MDNILQSEFSSRARGLYHNLFNLKYNAFLYRENGSVPLDFVIDLDTYVRSTKGHDFNGTVSLIGCHGIAACYTKKTFEGASLEIQNQVGKDAAASGADFNFLLGDNFYDDGISHANVRGQFQKSFIEPYANHGLNCFCISGNHDYYIHGATLWGHNSKLARVLSPVKYRRSNSLMTLQRGLRQVALTYTSPEMACNERELYEGGISSVRAAHRFWNMPYRYYALFSQKANFIILDSNSFLFDIAQQDWFHNTYDFIRRREADHSASSQAIAKKPLVLVMHHPFYCAGKRMRKLDDYHMYAKAFGQSVPIFNEQYGNFLGTDSSGEVGAMIFQFMEKNGKSFDYLFCAHDHILTVDMIPLRNSTDTMQLISGGGGGPLANNTKNLDKLKEFRQLSLGQDIKRTTVYHGGLPYGRPIASTRGYKVTSGLYSTGRMDSSIGSSNLGSGSSLPSSSSELGSIRHEGSAVPSLDNECYTRDLRLEHGHHLVRLNDRDYDASVFGLGGELKYRSSSDVS